MFCSDMRRRIIEELRSNVEWVRFLELQIEILNYKLPIEVALMSANKFPKQVQKPFDETLSTEIGIHTLSLLRTVK